MRFRLAFVSIFLLLAARAASGQNNLTLDVFVFQGFRATAPPGEPSASSVVVLAPDPGWSSEIEKQRQQIAETLGLDGVTVVGAVHAAVSSGSASSFQFGRDGAPPLILSVRPARGTGSRVSLDIHLREKGVPETELANFAVSGDLGKTFIVGGKSGGGPLLVSVTPRDGGTAPLAADGKKEIYKIGGDVRPPALIKKAEPKYPVSLRAEKKSGMVVLQATIDDQGVVRNPVIVRHSEPEFESAALDAVRQWQYSPATKDGKPVSVYLTITITFSLR